MNMYKEIVRIIDELEKEDRITDVVRFIRQARKSASIALKAVENEGNAIQALELRADIRTMDRILAYIDQMGE